ncbi:MAG: DUF2971 domain-containing protein [Ignavibacteriaceae bacterium]|nr:DUF2971 domain-containing protein [Ignavibacteriaceae bacterium]
MLTLYKYRNLSTRTEDIFKDRKIWLAQPATLNDPFECKFEDFEASQLQAKARETMGIQLSGFVMTAHMAHENSEDFFGIKGKDIKHLLRRIKSANSLSKKYRIANEFFSERGAMGFSDPNGHAKSLQNQMSEVGVFSLSEDPTNMLMWSHYSDNHKGLAIGFLQTPDSKLSDDKFCRPIIYSDEPNKFDFNKGHIAGLVYSKDEEGSVKSMSYISIDDVQVQKALFTKTTVWAYEKEWRYLMPKFGPYDFPAQISELVFGLKCSDDDCMKYIDLCKEIGGDIIFKKAVKTKDSTSLSLQIL